MLYIVATPIGNLEDMTFRAVRILHEVDVIAAEDTRHTGRLLKHYDIKTPMVSYHEYTDDQRRLRLLARLQSEDVALVSDAGMPSISDPGYRLVSDAIAAGVKVSPIPGATAVTAALVASGMPSDRFLFLGFLPRQRTARLKLVEELQHQSATMIFYESPHRLATTLHDLSTVFGVERAVVVAREITKLHEEFWRGTMLAAAKHYDEFPPKGEITLLVGGAKESIVEWSQQSVYEELQQRLASGQSRKDAAAEVASLTGWKKRDVYQLSLQ